MLQKSINRNKEKEGYIQLVNLLYRVIFQAMLTVSEGEEPNWLNFLGS